MAKLVFGVTSTFLGQAVPIDEVSIGHALIADTLELGLADTVRRYRVLCWPHGEESAHHQGTHPAVGISIVSRPQGDPV